MIRYFVFRPPCTTAADDFDELGSNEIITSLEKFLLAFQLKVFLINRCSFNLIITLVCGAGSCNVECKIIAKWAAAFVLPAH